MLEVRLPDDEFASLFREGVASPALNCTTPIAMPHAVLLGGQPGSGKSTVARASAAWFGSNNFVHVDVDRLRELHPAYFPILANPVTTKLAPSAVQRDCSLWADMLRDSAMTSKRNVLIENTMRSPDQVRESTAALRKAGYFIEAKIVAVHAQSSEVSLLQRYEHEMQAVGYGREMPVVYHDLAACGIIDTVLVIERDKLVDHLQIFDRRGKTIYENELVNGEWVNKPIGASVMHEFREASYDDMEKYSIAALWDDVISMMKSRNAPQSEIESIAVRQSKAREIANQVPKLSVLGNKNKIADGPVNQGAFHGRILEVNADTMLLSQKVGLDPKNVAVHDAKQLSRVPDVGEVVEIKYRFGVGQVSELRRGLGVGR